MKMNISKGGNRLLKRIMSSLLALLMVLGLIPASIVPAVAAETAPNQVTLDNIDRVPGLSGLTYNSPVFGENLNLHSIQVDSNDVAYDFAFCMNHGYSMRNSYTAPFELVGEMTTELSDVARIALNNFYWNRDNGNAVEAASLLMVQAIVWLDMAGKFDGTWVYDYNTPSVDAAGNEHPYTINQDLIDLISAEHCAIFRFTTAAEIAESKMLAASLLRSGNTFNGWIPLDSYRYFRYHYTGSESNVQDLLVAMPKVEEDSGDSAWIKIPKVDENNSPLAGATFTIYDDENCTSAFKTMTSESDGWAYAQVPFDAGESQMTFWVKETSAPAGYSIGSEGSTVRSVTVSVGANTTKETAKAVTTTPIVNAVDPNAPDIPDVPNVPSTPGTPEGVISKVDSRTNQGVGPATFRIFGQADNGGYVDTERETDASGNLELQWTNPSGDNYIQPGHYTVVEVTPPPGYELTTEAQHLELYYNEVTGEVRQSGPLIFQNDKLHIIQVIKEDASGKKLAGAVFNIYRDGQFVSTGTTGADGTFTFDGTDGKGVQSGFYEFEEITAPDGYLLPLRHSMYVYVDAANTDITTHILTFTNYEYPEITIEKIAAGTNNHLAGATFEVFIDAQKIGEYVTNGNGVIVLNYEQYKDFLSDAANEGGKTSWTIGVREISPPDGYLLDDAGLHEVELTKGGSTASFVFTDTRYPTLRLIKTSAGESPVEYLEGAVFGVSIDGTSIGSYKTNKDGIIEIDYDTYGRFLDESKDSWTVLFEELEPPPGYLKDDPSYQEIEIKRGMKLAEVTFTNTKYPEIVIIKRDTETGEPLPNTTFRITIDGAEFGTRTTNEAGEIRITYEEYHRFLDEDNLDNWTVTVTETEMPDLYNKDKQESSGDYTLTQQLKRGQSLTVFEFKDTHYRDIKVYKYDSETNWPLAGATFRLHCIKADDLDAGNISDRELTTDESGFVIFENVPNGTYEITEVNPPYGYNGTDEKQTVIVTSDSDRVIEFSFKNSPMTGILIRKIDSVTKQPIPNVRFRVTPMAPLTDAAEEYTTNDNGVINIENVVAGTYKIEEISTVDGYVLNTEPQYVEVDNQHDTYTVTFENNQKNMLNILKLDAVTRQPLEGAMFSISTAGGTHIANITTGIYGYATLANLKPGSYIVREIESPMGYELDPNPQTFEITEDSSGQVITLVFCNSPYANLYIRKCDALTHIGLEGAVFRVTKGNGEVVEDLVATDANGFLHIGHLTAGTYQIQEIKAPDGYVLSDKVYTVYLKDSETKTIEIPNNKPGGFAVRKVDADTGEALAGATFKLTTIEGTNMGEQTTDATGYARWGQLEAGWYVLTETKAPDGYAINSNPQNVEVKDFESTEIEWPNTHNASLTITKRDAETKLGLAGATFEVRTLTGTLAATLTTDANGVATSGLLKAGWYIITETVAPDGYVKSSEEMRVEIKDGTPESVDFFNTKQSGITIHKIDGTTDLPLAGATFELRATNNRLIDTYTTDASGDVSTRALDPGIYYIIETRAPDGYVLNGERITVEVVEGSSSSITVKNYPETTIQIYKTDSVTGDPLAYAEFEIKNSSGQTVEIITTDKTGWAYSLPLSPGEYIVKETKAPDGYEADTNEQRVTVKTGEHTILRLTNTPSTVLHITKIDGTTQKPLAGAVFQLSGICGREPCVIIGQYTTDDHGQAVTEPLEPGVYELKELYAPDGYVVDETIHEVCIKAGEYNNVIIENQALATLIVRKIDSKTGKPIAGAVFKVENADRMDLVGTLETDANGEAIFTGLTEGFYIVTETQAPSGYTISESPKTIQVEYGKANYCDFVDIPNGNLVIILTDKNTGDYLAGGHFIVTRENDQIIVFDGSTDITGTIVVGDLLPGWYYVEQVYAPDNYTMIDVNIHVEVKSGEQQTVYFEDETAGLVIEKVDKNYPELLLEGARFQVTRNADGIVIGEYVTGKDGLAIVGGLEPGLYTVTELVAPYGYDIDDEPKTIEVKGGTVAHVTFLDSAHSSITVNILEEGTRNPIAGAVVEVWKQNGALVNTYTSDTTGMVQTDKLNEGYYVLNLVLLPDGYSASVTEATVEVVNNIETTYTFEVSSKSSMKVLSVNKDQQAITGMHFTITGLDGAVIGDYVTGTDGSAVISNLAAGWYIVTETESPDGYVLSEKVEQKVEVVSNQETVVTFIHDRIYGLQILTTCEQTGKRVEGVVYKITELDGTIVNESATSNAEGLIFEELEPGWYVVTPVFAPDGYTLSSTNSRNVEVKANSLTAIEFTVHEMSSLRVKVIDGATKKGIYNVRTLLRSSDGTLKELITDNEGYITLDVSLLDSEYTLEMISVPTGYIIDTVPKSINTLVGTTTEITWTLYSEGGQIQVLVTSADYNKALDAAKETPIQGAVFTIMDADTFQTMGEIISDANGLAASSPLPIGRYIITQSKAGAYYKPSSMEVEVRLKINNDVVRVEFTNESVNLETSVKVKSNTSVQAGFNMRVDITEAQNTSDVRLDNFYIHIKVPTDAARVTTLITGQWNQSVVYKISYKTNMNDYCTLAENLQSTNTYQYDLSTQSLNLQSGEYVTDIRMEFGTVPANFTATKKTCFTQYVLSTVENNYKLISRVELGGQYNTVNLSTTNVDNNNPYSPSGGYTAADGSTSGGTGTAVVSGNSGQWTTSTGVWTTMVKSSVSNTTKPATTTTQTTTIPSTLPKTGY